MTFYKKNIFDPVAMINETVALGEQWANDKTAYETLKDTEASLKSKIFHIEKHMKTYASWTQIMQKM